MAPLAGLDAADRRILTEHFGPAILGTSIPPITVNEPRDFFPLNLGTVHYKVMHAAESNEAAETRYSFEPKHPFGPLWRVEQSPTDIDLIKLETDGSLTVTGSEDREHSALTRYEPAIPLLPRGFRAGQELHSHVAVAVYDQAELSATEHTGELDVTHAHLGAYKLTLDGSTWDAILVKSTVRGMIGPAQVADTLYRFFSRGHGLVAQCDQRDVSAFWIYSEQARSTRVLLERSPGSR